MDSRIMSNAESRVTDAANQFVLDYLRGLPKGTLERAREAFRADNDPSPYIGDYFKDWPSSTLEDLFGSVFISVAEAKLLAALKA